MHASKDSPAALPIVRVFAVRDAVGGPATQVGQRADGPAEAQDADLREALGGEACGEEEQVGCVEEGEGVGAVEVGDCFGVSVLST